MTLADDTLQQGMVAVQGPRAESVASALIGTVAGPGFFRCTAVDRGAAGVWLLSRSGYTGEDGFEIICPATSTPVLWRAAVEAGGAAHGARGARHPAARGGPLSLRKRAHPGHHSPRSRSQLDSGARQGDGVPGSSRAAAPARAGDEAWLVGLALGVRGIPRSEQEVRSDGGRVGVVTSGGYLPILQQGIALAYMEAGRAGTGQPLDVVGRDRALAGQVVDLPFVATRVKRRPRRGLRQREE